MVASFGNSKGIARIATHSGRVAISAWFMCVPLFDSLFDHIVLFV
jgi:hypothetical protein